MQNINRLLLITLIISSMNISSDDSGPKASANLASISDENLMSIANHLSQGCWGSDPRCLCPVINIICEVQVRKLDSERLPLEQELKYINGKNKNAVTEDRKNYILKTIARIKIDQDLLKTMVLRCNNSPFVGKNS